MVQDSKKLVRRLAELVGLQISGKQRLGIDLWNDLRRLDLNPTTIFDVGANVGQWAEDCRRELPEAAIHSFEPEPTAYLSLVHKFRSDRLHFAHPIAISKNSGKSSLRISTSSTMHSLEPSFQNRQLATIDVETQTIDQMLHALDIPTIHLLKIDVEGHEMACLEGTSAALVDRRIDSILVEVGFAGGYHTKFCSIEAYLYPLGLRFLSLYDVVPQNKKPEVYYANALFVREGVGFT
ncbi:MAG: FkbM family methyltransferase [Anaerolineae bacterium]